MTTGCKIGARSLDQTFHEYEAARRAQGFNEVVERHWLPLTVLENHEHEFHAARVPHAERYGSNGATYWVARRSHPSV
jgi:hypothetical protein